MEINVNMFLLVMRISLGLNFFGLLICFLWSVKSIFSALINSTNRHEDDLFRNSGDFGCHLDSAE
jgi:hypothetical protein